MNRAVEMYYTVQAVGLLLGFCPKTVIVKLKAGEFGSGVNGYLDARRVFSEVEPIAARSIGELRRKAA